MKSTCFNAALLSIFLLPASRPIFAQANCPGVSCVPDSQGWAFLTLINNYRAQNGAGPLQVSATLENSSQWMSNDMATKNYFSHTDSLGRDPFTRMAAFGYSYEPAGENIAAGYSDAESAFTAWQNACDPDGSGNCTYAHRANMLDPSYAVIGIGRAFGSSSTYGWYWTTDFGAVVDKTITPSSSAPTITSFSASPASISAGQVATLTWNVSGASSLSINNGVGDVSTKTSVTVSPGQTATYILTATNSVGSTTAQTTITVSSSGTGGGTGSPVPASMSSPTPGSTLGGSSVTFQWTPGTGVSGYWLYVSKVVVGGSELFNSAEGSQTSQVVSTLPTDGSAVYVRLWSLVGSNWAYNDYRYTAASLTAAATITSPAPGSTLSAATVTFQWTAGTGVSQYRLYISKIAPGNSELFNSTGSQTSQVVSGLPTDGSTLYIQLSSLIGSSWVSNNYTYITAGSSSTTVPATMISPTPGSTLTGSTVTFQWTMGAGVSQCWLYASKTQVGASDLFKSNEGSQTSQVVSTLPTDGSTVYVRLWSLIGTNWIYNDYTYQAF